MEIVTKEDLNKFSEEIKKQLEELRVLLESRNEKKILKNKELKEYLGCSYSTIDKMRQNNTLPYKKVLGNYYYSVEEVNRVFLSNK